MSVPCGCRCSGSTHLSVGFGSNRVGGGGGGGIALNSYSILGRMGSHFLAVLWDVKQKIKSKRKKPSGEFGFKNPDPGKWVLPKEVKKIPSESGSRSEVAPLSLCSSGRPSAAELKLKDVRDATESISTAPQNRPKSPPTGVTHGLRPMCRLGVGLLRPLVIATVCQSSPTPSAAAKLLSLSYLQHICCIYAAGRRFSVPTPHPPPAPQETSE